MSTPEKKPEPQAPLPKMRWEGEEIVPGQTGFELRGETPPAKPLSKAEAERKVRERFTN